MGRDTIVGLETRGGVTSAQQGTVYKAQMGKVRSRQYQQVPRLREIQRLCGGEAFFLATAGPITHPVSPKRELNLQDVELVY